MYYMRDIIPRKKNEMNEVFSRQIPTDRIITRIILPPLVNFLLLLICTFADLLKTYCKADRLTWVSSMR